MKAAAREILREAEVASDDRWLGEKWVPPHALTDMDLWTYASVKNVLVDSFMLLRRTGGRAGHARLKAAWPAYMMEQPDFVQQTLNQTLAAQFVAEKAARRAETRHQSKTLVTDSEQQSRMDAVLCGWKDKDGKDQAAWLAGPLFEYPEFREKLIAWITAEVRGEPTTALCERKRWALASFKRHRDKAAGIIADRLNRLGMEVW